eukprot:SAG31_NODE_29733_length_390_cov_1.769759_1_plen_48_part_01
MKKLSCVTCVASALSAPANVWHSSGRADIASAVVLAVLGLSVTSCGSG